MKKDLRGVIALPPTPLTKDGKIDDESLRAVIDFQLENGCQGVGVLAAIGEGYLMSDKDWKTVVKISVDHMNGKKPLQVGIAAQGTGKAIELAKAAKDFGADAVLAFNPLGTLFEPCSIEGLTKHYKALTDAVDNLHVVPYAQGQNPIPLDVLKTLVDEGRISYHKYAYRNPQMLQQISKTLGNNLFIFCGADPWTLRYLLMGCKGIMTATASVFPKENVTLLSLVEKGEIWEARKYWYEKFLPWNDAGFYENWQIAHKVALKEMGIIKTAESPPSQGHINDYHVGEIKALLKYLGKV